ncbi:hypothetical protein U9M48_034201 [Paspalum notatum var. saurae]|uniref:Uncharacterized protein n=1 Tax=Paspalum notatum var. saurae TaxID=547442 RepID=A0AAQ3U8U2_PASNO
MALPAGQSASLRVKLGEARRLPQPKRTLDSLAQQESSNDAIGLRRGVGSNERWMQSLRLLVLFLLETSIQQQFSSPLPPPSRPHLLSFPSDSFSSSSGGQRSKAIDEVGKMVEHLFDDTFTVTRLDPDGKKFDKVTRIEAHSDQVYMQLDVATEVYPMRANDKFNMVLVRTLNLDGTPDTGYYTQAGRKTLADQYDYVMHGKLYKISEDSSKDSSAKVYSFSELERLFFAYGATSFTVTLVLSLEVYASFGGLLMMLRGDASTAANLELDQRLFLLIKKV